MLPLTAHDEKLKARFHTQWTEIKLILDLLTKFVQGLHLGFQNFLRQQTSHKHSFNLLLQAESLLSTLVSDGLSEPISTRSLGVVSTVKAILDFLSRCMQGPCEENQILLANSESVTIMQALIVSLPNDVDPIHRDREVEQLKARLLTLEPGSERYLELEQTVSKLETEEYKPALENVQARIHTLEIQIEACKCLSSMLDGCATDEVPAKMLPNLQISDMTQAIIHAGMWKHFKGKGEFTTEKQDSSWHEASSLRAEIAAQMDEAAAVSAGLVVPKDKYTLAAEEAHELEFNKVTLIYTLLMELIDIDPSGRSVEKKMEDTLEYEAGMEASSLAHMHASGISHLTVTKKIRNMEKRCKSVEVTRAEHVFRVHFVVPEICVKVSKLWYFRRHFDELMRSIEPRDNPTAKAACFVCRILDLRDEMYHYRRLYTHSFTKFLMMNRTLIERLPFTICTASFILQLLFYGEHQHNYKGYDGARVLVRTLEICQVISCFLFCVSYFVVEVPTATLTRIQ